MGIVGSIFSTTYICIVEKIGLKPASETEMIQRDKEYTNLIISKYMLRMPGRQAVLNEMKNRARGAPKSSQVRIDTLLDLCKTGQLNNKRSLENAIVALRHPALSVRRR